jgi:hypothetical protein
MTQRDTTTDRTAIVVPLLSLIIGVAAAVLASDVIIGVAVGAAIYAVVTRIAKARAGHDDHPYSHR